MAEISFYDLNPIQVIDQNHWTVYHPDVAMRFQQEATYTPLVEWSTDLMQYKTTEVVETEMFPGDVAFNELDMNANYVQNAFVPDTRSRKWKVSRYGGKVMYHKSSSYFNQWNVSGGHDWRPLLQSTLGYHVVGTHEKLARAGFFKQPKMYWRYANGKTNWGALSGESDTFNIGEVNYWNFALGNTGSPLIPGDKASAKLAYIAPGAQYDIYRTLPLQSQNEASLWRDSMVYSGSELALRGEIGGYKGVRFIVPQNNIFGENPNVLYNAGAISKQYGVILPITAGDGAPDPETTAVDSTWYVGQKNVTHSIKLESFTPGDFALNDWVTIHTSTTSEYGVTNGVNPFHEMTITRRVVAIDETNHTLSFDRPISNNYMAAFVGQSISGATPATFYAYVTKATHIGFSLILGARGSVKGKVMKPLEFYAPKPVDDFESVWRFTYDELVGINLGEPNLHLLYFYTVSIPKPGGRIGP